MSQSLYDAQYNPDILSCLANLSNDEVFTPPEIANQMLDMLPQELFKSPDTKFLDPACKSGVFLREIAKRLIEGEKDIYPDLQERIDHIMHEQLYGIAITELTSLMSRRSLYCSKYPNGIFSISKFNEVEGNIRFKSVKHTWENGKCKYCGASQSELERDSSLETHAYEFIHTLNPEEIKNMKFDVICSNPPYQLETGGSGKQAKPIYNMFVEQAKKLNPKYMTMIIPSRWFSGGMGLDGFRKEMLTDKHISKIVDFSNASECFPNINLGGGVCYFLWERDAFYDDGCEFTSIKNGTVSKMKRKLDEFEVLVRYNQAISIINKVIKSPDFKPFSQIVSSLTPFGLPTDYRGSDKKTPTSLVLHSSKGITFISKSEITKGTEYLGKYKVLLSKAIPGKAGEAGNDGKHPVFASTTKVIDKNDVCTHSYLMVGCYEEKQEADNLLTYMNTAFMRFLTYMSVSSINLSQSTFQFVPLLDFNKKWTDEMLYKKYSITNDEIEF